MRSPVIAVLAGVVACAAPVAGQEPVPLVAPPTAPASQPLPGSPPDGLPPARPAADPPADPPADPTRWRADLVVGLPAALRVQRRVGEGNGWVEFGGATYGPVPSVFAGVRGDGRVFEGRRNLLLARPGADVYYSPVSGDGGWLFDDFHGVVAVTLDVDLNWHYRWSDRFHQSVGLKAGCGVGVAGRMVFPVPVLGLTVGCQF